MLVLIGRGSWGVGSKGPKFKTHEKANKIINMNIPGKTIKACVSQVRIDLNPEIKIWENTPNPPNKNANIWQK